MKSLNALTASVCFRTSALPALLLMLFSPTSQAQFELPDTDLWLIHVQQGKVQLTPRPRQLTDYSGYDNQPVFTHDGQRLYFTRGNAQGYTDIYALTLLSGEVEPVTRTPLSEFSPLPTWHRGDHSLAMVQVQEDGAQWLVSYNPDQQHFDRLNAADAVGYHSWLGATGSALFLVDDPPQLAYWEQGRAQPQQIVASNVGRRLQSVYRHDVPQALLYSRIEGLQTVLYRYDLGRDESQRLTSLPEGGQDFFQDTDGYIWLGVGPRLYRWHAQQPRWRLAANLAAFGIHSISRIAVDHSASHLVLVDTP